MPEARVAAGKPAQGTVTLAAAHQGGSIVIEVRDDGRGLNRDKLLQKAIERGLPVSEPRRELAIGPEQRPRFPTGLHSTW
jgi:two-component system chemotaxis sensor kinase CheA